MFRYKLRTQLILMALLPPIIGFWPDIKKHATARASQITASDVAVVLAASSLIALRVHVYFIRARWRLFWCVVFGRTLLFAPASPTLGHPLKGQMMHLADAGTDYNQVPPS